MPTFEQQNFGKLPSDDSNNVNLLGTLDSQLDAKTQALQTLQQNRSMMEAMLAQQSAATSTPGIDPCSPDPTGPAGRTR